MTPGPEESNGVEQGPAGLGFDGADADMKSKGIAKTILDLEPTLVWKYFDKISQIPRDSGKEEKVREYLINLATEKGWEYRTDKTGNTVLAIPGKGKLANGPIVTLQAHMDMVCIADEGVEHDFTKDPINTVVGWRDNGNGGVEEFLRAVGTTLGADNGVGLAMALALASDESIEDMLPIEILATVSEETGLDGAKGLDPEIVKGRILINLDTEEYGEVYYGSAGGRDLKAEWPIERITPPEDYIPVRLKLSGFPGGHSGVEIHKGRKNPIKDMLDIASKFSPDYELVASLDGGDKLNAIPTSCELVFWAPKSKLEEAAKGRTVEEVALEGEEKGDGHYEDHPIDFSIELLAGAPAPMSYESSKRLIDALHGVHHGVIKMSEEVEDLVQTSNNVARITTSKNIITFWAKTRSSVNEETEEFQEGVKALLEASGAKVELSDPYSGWKADPASKLVKATVDAYTEIMGHEPEVKAIHAGLECGEFANKLDGVEIVSFGPTITGAHTPEEEVLPYTVEGATEVLKRLVTVEIPKYWAVTA